MRFRRKTDISIIRDGVPIRANSGITVGNWKIYVKGMYVDTFGLGGDSEVLLAQEGGILLGNCRIMPICMATSRYPKLLKLLEKEKAASVKINSWRKNIYVGIKDIAVNPSYSAFERRVAEAFYQNPMNLIELEYEHGISVVPDSLRGLIEQGVLIRCGITPTDAMHVLGDYNGYETKASIAAMEVMGELLGMTGEELSRAIYEKVRKKLYCNIARILFWDKYPALRKEGISQVMETLVEGLYEQAVNGRIKEGFLNLTLSCDVPLIGVGGPIGVFLEEVANLLGTTALIGTHSNVANALGAIVGSVEVCVSMKDRPECLIVKKMQLMQLKVVRL